MVIRKINEITNCKNICNNSNCNSCWCERGCAVLLSSVSTCIALIIALCRRNCSRKCHLNEEVELFVCQVALVHFDLHRHLQREEQLVLLEDARAAVRVDVHRQRLHYVRQPLLQHCTQRRQLFSFYRTRVYE